MEFLHNLIIGESVWAFVGAFLGGLLVSFTPCVYPVVPITVSIISYYGAKDKGKMLLCSLLYVMGMSLTYTFLGMVAVLGGRIFGFWAGSKWLYLGAGNICLLASFVMFEFIPFGSVLISLTSKIMPTADDIGTDPIAAMRGRGDGDERSFARKASMLLSPLIMGMTSVLVMGPCTTPALGTLLAVIATSHSILRSFCLLFGFSLGMGFLVILLGMFTGFVLPRSGLWLKRIQQFSGLVMIVTAQYLFIKAGILWDR